MKYKICSTNKDPEVRTVKNWTKYSTEHIRKAIAKIKEPGVSIRDVCEQMGISERTLRRYRRNESQITARPGPAPMLPEDDEAGISQAMLWCFERGLGVTKSDAMRMAKEVSESKGMPFRTANGLPSEHWYKNFIQRAKLRDHKLSLRKPNVLSRLRAKCASEEAISGYFEFLEAIIKEKNIDVSTSIYNVDETAISMDIAQQKILCETGTRQVFKLSNIQGEQSFHITLFSFIGSNGVATPPAFIFPGKRMPTVVAKAVAKFNPDSACIVTGNGWIEKDVFQLAIEAFVKLLPKPENRGHVLLIFDGHETHLSLQIAKLCCQWKIEVVCFPPHCSHIVQPLDLLPFGVLKTEIRKILSSALALKGVVLKQDVPELIKPAWEKATHPEIIKKAFALAGLSPFTGIAAIPKKKLAPAKAIAALAGKQAAEDAIGSPHFVEHHVESKLAEAKQRRMKFHLTSMSPLEEMSLRCMLYKQALCAAHATNMIHKEQVGNAKPGSSAGTDMEGEPSEEGEDAPAKPAFIHKSGTQYLTGKEWIEEMERQMQQKEKEKEEAEEKKRLREEREKAKAEEAARLRPCMAIIRSGKNKGQQCSTLVG